MWLTSVLIVVQITARLSVKPPLRFQAPPRSIGREAQRVGSPSATTLHRASARKRTLSALLTLRRSSRSVSSRLRSQSPSAHRFSALRMALLRNRLTFLRFAPSLRSAHVVRNASVWACSSIGDVGTGSAGWLNAASPARLLRSDAPTAPPRVRCLGSFFLGVNGPTACSPGPRELLSLSTLRFLFLNSTQGEKRASRFFGERPGGPQAGWYFEEDQYSGLHPS